MIIETLANSSPYTIGSGNAGKIVGPAIQVPSEIETNDICICDYVPCGIIVEKVFCSPLPNTDWWKNDKSEFLFRRLVSSDTVAIELHKDGNKIEDLNNNNFGTFFNGFPSGSAEQQLYVGYLLDWQLVFDTHGLGKYQIITQLNIIGVPSEQISREFQLCLYSDLAANGTVRIESTQNGNIEGGDFDFTGLSWYQSIRVPAIFGNPLPVFESTTYVTSTRKVVQNRAKLGNRWTLNTKLMSWEVVKLVIYNYMLANEILITDYQIKAQSIWRRIGVFPEEFDKPDINGNPNRRYNVTFVDNKDILIKRNF